MDAIAAAGRVVELALHAAQTAAQPGVTTAALDAVVAQVIAGQGAEAAFVGYPSFSGGQPFPASCCISINEELVHGIPGPRALTNGDVVSVDVGVRLNGWCADAAITVGVGTLAPQHAALISGAWAVLERGLQLMQPGTRWSTVADAMQRVAVQHGLGMVDGWMGHGVGRQVHEAPQVPCMVTPGLREQRDFTLLPGMVLAVEPLLVEGGGTTIAADGCATPVAATQLHDGWTVAVADGRRAAHVEHTVAITRHGPRILTGSLRQAHTQQGGCGR